MSFIRLSTRLINMETQENQLKTVIRFLINLSLRDRLPTWSKFLQWLSVIFPFKVQWETGWVTFLFALACVSSILLSSFTLLFICHSFIYLVSYLLRLLRQSEKGVCKGPGYYLYDPLGVIHHSFLLYSYLSSIWSLIPI